MGTHTNMENLGKKPEVGDGDWINRRWQGEGEVASSSPKLTPAQQKAEKEKRERIAAMRDTVDIEGNPGRVCSHPGCGVLDFLPTQCEVCSKVFCANHATFESHGCERPVGRVAPSCLLCQKPIHVGREEGETVDYAMDRHIASGCKSGLAEKVRKQRHAMDHKCKGKAEAKAKGGRPSLPLPA